MCLLTEWENRTMCLLSNWESRTMCLLSKWEDRTMCLLTEWEDRTGKYLAQFHRCLLALEFRGIIEMVKRIYIYIYCIMFSDKRKLIEITKFKT